MDSFRKIFQNLNLKVHSDYTNVYIDNLIIKIENYVNHIKQHNNNFKVGRVVRPKKTDKNKNENDQKPKTSTQKKSFWFTVRNRNQNKFTNEHKTVACDLYSEAILCMKKATSSIGYNYYVNFMLIR